jgi:hypothetical protein
MYLNDAEILELVSNSLKYIKEGGYFFFRESCFHASGNIKNAQENPTEYRVPTAYVDFFQSKTIEEDDKLYGFELVFARPNRTYIEVTFSFKACVVYPYYNLINCLLEDEK